MNFTEVTVSIPEWVVSKDILITAYLILSYGIGAIIARRSYSQALTNLNGAELALSRLVVGTVWLFSPAMFPFVAVGWAVTLGTKPKKN